MLEGRCQPDGAWSPWPWAVRRPLISIWTQDRLEAWGLRSYALCAQGWDGTFNVTGNCLFLPFIMLREKLTISSGLFRFS